MKTLSVLLLFGGYMLVYAAVANGGQFATEPWKGLFWDAYTGNSAIVQGILSGRAITQAGGEASGAIGHVAGSVGG